MSRWKSRWNILVLIAAFFWIWAFGAVEIRAAEPVNTEVHFENDRVLDGVYKEETVYFQVEDYWKMEAAAAEVHIKLSSMLLDVPAELTFEVNGTPVKSIDLSYKKGANQTISMAIPVDQLKEGVNSFTVTGFAQIYDEEGCLDEFSGANWVVIQKDSLIDLFYQMKEPSYKISEYPYPLISSANKTGEGVAVAVPDQASDDELTAAAWIKAGLAQAAESKDQVKLMYSSEYTKEKRPAVVVSLYEHLDENQKKILKNKGISKEKLKNHAAILITKKEKGREEILIVSEKGSCLTEAAWLLMDESRRTQETTDTALVKDGSADLLKKNEKNSTEINVSDWNGSEEGIELKGSFRREYTLYPPEGITYVLGTEDRLELNFRYSENLDFNRSLFTVYVNGEPIGSKKLKKSAAGGDKLELVIPEDLAGEKLDSITFAFDLEIEELYCTMRLDEMPWGFVSGDSVIKLSGLQNNYLSFEVTPYPYVKNGAADHYMYVVPDSPSKAELETLGTLAGMYGRSMKPYGEMEVVSAGQISKKEAKNAQIAVIGTFQNQKILKEVNQELPFSIDMENKKFKGNDQFAFSDLYAASTAVMQIIPSTYNEDNAMLVVAAPNDTALGYLNTYLCDLEKQENLKGDAVIVDSGLEMRSFKFQSSSIESERPNLRERLEQNKETVIFSVIAVAVMLLILLAAVLIFIRTRAINKKEDQ